MRRSNAKHISLKWLDVMPLVAGGLVAVGGLLSMAGWIAGIPRLLNWDNQGITIKFNTALCITIAAFALILSELVPRRKLPVRLLASFVAIVGAATLFQHLTQIDLGIDTLLFNEPLNAPATSAPGRMGPPASSTLLILGLALIFSTYDKLRRVAANIAVIPLVVAALSVTGYVFNADQLYSVPRLTGIAFQTAVMLVVLSLGVIASIREYGLASIFLRNDAGGLLFRRLVLPVIAISFLLGSLRLLGQNAGYFDTAFGTSMRTLAEIILIVGLLWWTAESISRLESEARLSKDARAENETHRRIAAAQEAERRRIARDIHDHIGQQFTGLRLRLDAMMKKAPAGSDLSTELTEISEQSRKFDADLSLLVWQMRPGVLDTHGLTSALNSFTREWSANHGLEVEFHSTDAGARLMPEIETNLYRIIQEALNNVIKHANAKRVSITINYLPEEAVLIIEDDGMGFDVDAEAIHTTEGSGFGLLGMKERAALIGGRLAIESNEGGGTAILIRVPRKPRSFAADTNGKRE